MRSQRGDVSSGPTGPSGAPSRISRTRAAGPNPGDADTASRYAVQFRAATGSGTPRRSTPLSKASAPLSHVRRTRSLPSPSSVIENAKPVPALVPSTSSRSEPKRTCASRRVSPPAARRTVARRMDSPVGGTRLTSSVSRTPEGSVRLSRRRLAESARTCTVALSRSPEPVDPPSERLPRSGLPEEAATATVAASTRTPTTGGACRGGPDRPRVTSRGLRRRSMACSMTPPIHGLRRPPRGPVSPHGACLAAAFRPGVIVEHRTGPAPAVGPAAIPCAGSPRAGHGSPGRRPGFRGARDQAPGSVGPPATESRRRRRRRGPWTA